MCVAGIEVECISILDDLEWHCVFRLLISLDKHCTWNGWWLPLPTRLPVCCCLILF